MGDGRKVEGREGKDGGSLSGGEELRESFGKVCQIPECLQCQRGVGKEGRLVPRAGN